MDQERVWKNLDSHVSQQRRFLSSRASSRAGSPLRHTVPAPALVAEAQAHLDLDTLVAAHSPDVAAAAA